MAAEGIQFPWRWYGGTISTDLDIIWEMSGKWGGRLCSSFVIEKIDAEGNVEGIYSWGRGRNFDEGYMRFDSRVKDGKINFGRRAKFTFMPSTRNEGRIAGERRYEGHTSRVTMEKVEAR